MVYKHRFHVKASLDQVWKFHQKSSSMAAITPPLMSVKVRDAPKDLKGGDKMHFTLWLGPVPIDWTARFENVSSSGFTDRQIEGPFQQWIHEHTFRAVEEELTEVIDEVNAKLRPHVIWGPIGFGMWLGLPLLFAYRGWKTRRILENRT